MTIVARDGNAEKNERILDFNDIGIIFIFLHNSSFCTATFRLTSSKFTPASLCVFLGADLILKFLPFY
jgi:hypothetical protein